jgi:polyisoprenoid-binding protein YceI
VKQIRLISASAAGATALVVAGLAHAAFSSATDTRASFQATGTAGLRLEGSTSELAVAEQDGNLIVTVSLGNIATGIALRDHHVRDDLEVQKFPTAVLTVQRSALKAPPAGQQVTADVPGSLLLHGQTKPVTVHYDATGDAASATVTGTFHVNANDFGIVIPSYLGVTVKPDITVSAHFRAVGN